MANSVDPDQTSSYAVCGLGLHCLPQPVCPNTQSKYSNLIKSNHLRNYPGSVPVQINDCTSWRILIFNFSVTPSFSDILINVFKVT